MGKVKSLIFSGEDVCDAIDKTMAKTDEEFSIGLSTFETILPPAFCDSNGVEYRLYDRMNPSTLVAIESEDDIKKYELETTTNPDWKYSIEELAKMREIIKNNQRPELQKLKPETLDELRAKGYKPTYRGFQIKTFKKIQIEKWYKKLYAHTPEVTHTILQGHHAKNTFGSKETKREFSFALAGFIFGILLVLMITLPTIAGLVARIG